MKNKYLLFTSFLLCCLFFSCVSSDKYKELVQVKEYLEEENKRLTSQDNENRDLRTSKRQDQLALDQANAEIIELKANFNSLNGNYEDLARRYNGLIADNRNIGSGSANKKQYWEEEIAKKQVQIEDMERQIQTLRYTLGQKEKKVQELLQMLRASNGN